jgi:signal transduction histidine kinase
VILSVHNSGNPIPPERWSAIFDYLEREGESDQAGWGIGLPFVRSVAEGHGG